MNDDQKIHQLIEVAGDCLAKAYFEGIEYWECFDALEVILKEIKGSSFISWLVEKEK